jgi:MFS family permease
MTAGLLTTLRSLSHDARLLFLARSLRLFAYGSTSIVLVLYLRERGLEEEQVGRLLTLTLVGDALLSLWLATRADRSGRKRILVWSSWLMVLAGAVFVASSDPWLLLVAAIVGVISPSGNEVGSFLSIEQASLAQVVPVSHRTGVFAWYALAGSIATASGALLGGGLASLLQSLGASALDSYRALLVLYTAAGLAMLKVFSRLTSAVEVEPAGDALAAGSASRWGLAHSRRIVLGLSALFALDAFAGGFIVQSLLAYWFHLRFGLEAATLGAIFFGANLLAGASALAAARLSSRIGLVRTMVFTHLPSNVLLLFVPLVPSAGWAVALLWLRFSISQMDVPTRQSYTMAVVHPHERSAAAGITGVARTAGASLSPWLSALLLGSPALLNAPFFLAGGLKIAYDLLLYRSFVRLRAPDEGAR